MVYLQVRVTFRAWLDRFASKTSKQSLKLVEKQDTLFLSPQDPMIEVNEVRVFLCATHNNPA